MNSIIYEPHRRKQARRDLNKTSLKFVFSKKATEIEKKIFIDNLTVCSKCQIDDEELAEFCGLLRKHEL